MTLLKLAMLIQQEIHGIERLGPIWRPLWWHFYSRMISWYYCALELPDMLLKDGLASNGQEPHLRFPFFMDYPINVNHHLRYGVGFMWSSTEDEW
ncbi:unnamed protein product [Musa hybrid cultivar]